MYCRDESKKRKRKSTFSLDQYMESGGKNSSQHYKDLIYKQAGPGKKHPSIQCRTNIGLRAAKHSR